ncbi:hypothetical protein N9N28_06830 [Rubripirellula amarantea]|nr:hypothetical protein [Rubripirellula amarantea]
MKPWKFTVFALPILVASSAVAQTTRESEDVGGRYEDDAWYDVSEWFDGNDYNPTDEAIGRWDDEKFDYYDKQTSTDNDNDIEAVDVEEFYGEDYDHGYARYYDADKDGNYERMSRYHDTDGDRLNDSYATYRDDDGDGLYDDYDFNAIAGKNAVQSSNVAQTTQKGLSGKAVRVSGKVKETKMVKRYGEVSLLAHVNADDGKSIWVDFGPDASTMQVFKDDAVTVYGPVTKRGNKQVLVATTVELDGQQRSIERNGRRYSGTVKSTKTAQVRGEKHMMAKLETDSGKMLTVDLGNPDSQKQLKEGSKLTVTGVPVKLGDRVVLIADENHTSVK